jgi:hypothetical protein
VAEPSVNRWIVLEVHNFGGFFGGDTVTLTAAGWPEGDEETITIDEKALANLHDRYQVAAGMVFDLATAGQRVERAELLGAADWSLLELILQSTVPAETLAAPRIRAYRCAPCAIWVLGQPAGDGDRRRCRLCGGRL